MVTLAVIAIAATTLVLAAGVVVVLTGCFPRLAALTVRAIDGLFSQLAGEHTHGLDLRERSELIARLWVPL